MKLQNPRKRVISIALFRLQPTRESSKAGGFSKEAGEDEAVEDFEELLSMRFVSEHLWPATRPGSWGCCCCQAP